MFTLVQNAQTWLMQKTSGPRCFLSCENCSWLPSLFTSRHLTVTHRYWPLYTLQIYIIWRSRLWFQIKVHLTGLFKAQIHHFAWGVFKTSTLKSFAIGNEDCNLLRIHVGSGNDVLASGRFPLLSVSYLMTASSDVNVSVRASDPLELTELDTCHREVIGLDHLITGLLNDVVDFPRGKIKSSSSVRFLSQTLNESLNLAWMEGQKELCICNRNIYRPM